MTTALLWFRRDLRLGDHPALTRAVRDFDRVIAVFVLDDALRRGRFASAPREAFMLGCLRALDADLRERGAGSSSARAGPSANSVRWPPRSAPTRCCGRATSRHTPGLATPG